MRITVVIQTRETTTKRIMEPQLLLQGNKVDRRDVTATLPKRFGRSLISGGCGPVISCQASV